MTLDVKPYILPFDVVEAKSVEEYRAELPRSDVVLHSRESFVWSACGLNSDIHKLLVINRQSKYRFADGDPSMSAHFHDYVVQIEERWNDYFSTRRQVLLFKPDSKVNLRPVANGIVRVNAGCSFHHLNDALKKNGLCFPPTEKRDVDSYPMYFTDGRLEGALVRNPPSAYDITLGPWVDRIAGLTLLTVTGELIHVDPESGWVYDGINLLECVCGTNGALGFLMDVDILTIPASLAPDVEIEEITGNRAPCTGGIFDPGVYLWCQRVPLELLEYAVQSARPFVRNIHRESGLMLGSCPLGHEIPRYDGDRAMFGHLGDRNIEFHDDKLVSRIQAAKKRLDPENRLCPRAISIL